MNRAAGPALSPATGNSLVRAVSFRLSGSRFDHEDEPKGNGRTLDHQPGLTPALVLDIRSARNQRDPADHGYAVARFTGRLGRDCRAR